MRDRDAWRGSWVRGILGVLLLVGASAAYAQAPGAGGADGERTLSLTVYNQNLALVRDVRALAVPSETDWVLFQDVPERIDPTSVHLRPVDGGELTVLEQNYRYDLVSADKIFERFVDAEIQVILEEGRLYEGRLLSRPGGQIVLGGADGAVTILNREKVTDLQFPALPEGLITRPTLAWLLAGGGGERRLEVSYLTGGFDWHAEYVAVVAEDERAMDFAGWVSVDNQSGATYPEAELQLVAGDVHRATPPAKHFRGGRSQEADMMLSATAFEEEAFFEYHLYTLERPTTLGDNETKQIALFPPATCEVTKVYEANPQRDQTKVRVVLVFENSEAAGLGMPLPKGTVRVYKRDRREKLQFLGEDRIDHTPRDEEARIFIGNAFDLVVERTVLDQRRISPEVTESDVKIELRNRKTDEAATIVVQEDLSGFWEVRRASHPYEKTSAMRIEFAVEVPAGETREVTFTVRRTR